MDLKLSGAEATTAERAAVDALFGAPESRWEGGDRGDAADSRFARGGHEARARRHLLLPALHAVQDAIGHVSRGAVDYIALRLTVPPAEIYGVASFYALFEMSPMPATVAHVCDDVGCMARGADALIDSLERECGPDGAPCATGRGAWKRSPCLGLCEKAPAVLVRRAGEGRTDATIAPATAAQVAAELQGDPATARAAVRVMDSVRQKGEPHLRLLARVGVVDPASLHDYRSRGGYAALARAFTLGPEAVVREVTDAKLMGRGGAAFPTGVKWGAVLQARALPHHVVCNADESEPGTFKDRVLMEEDPYAVIEALTLAGYATGSAQGWLYVRGEYPEAHAALAHAIAECRRAGLLGERVMGQHGFAFDIELRKGAGAYICGEETALFNSIEGYRGEPRNKPPFPVHEGLFGKPTAINNVETLVNVLEIVRDGAAAYAAIGTEGSRGPKLFCVAGSVAKPGLYELPFGATLRELLSLAGVPDGGRALQAVLLGGAAGSFVTPEEFDVPLTFEGTRAIGASLGSGVVLAFDGTVDMRAIVRRIARFFRDESCGQCVPCRVGTVRQEEALARLCAGAAGTSRDETLVILDDLDRAMRDASICGLGHTAAVAVQSALRKLKLFGEVAK
ncbi:MAG: NAD(P)H-dependent oxidoreductase subunit E [Candidatus Eisenbacteria bacterium]|uniref:NAD(P)H-dependent oxidoreductase subunit E n=1 Tax=Eiseniibacteriota bacterium TaxID=2212470 RepID=A0A933SDP5_UNCEI|nr:NAD(P)H-dependent oxidoreductase subunit E [Candidatus Eisenbacteria bacterium]